MRICVLYALVGVVVGAFAGLTFVIMNRTWKRVSVPVVVTPVTIGILATLREYVQSNVANPSETIDYITPSIWYMSGLMLSFCAVFVLICYLIKTQTGKAKLRVLDIVLSYSQVLTIYYKSRQEEIEREFNYDNFVKQKDQLAADEENLHAQQEVLKRQLSAGVHLVLPIDQIYGVSNSFLSVFPIYIDNYCKFYHEMRKLTKIFIDKLSTGVNHKDHLSGYLVGICMNINNILFDSRSDVVRSHVRIKKDNYYVKYISVIGGEYVEKNMTRIPVDEGLICHSAINRCSLVKSLNPQLHYRAHNDSVWKDYISFAITDYEENSIPLLSFGISIKNKELHGFMLVFLNMIKIERIISEFLERINKEYSIIDVLKEIAEGLPNESNH